MLRKKTHILSNLMEQILSKENLNQVYLQVVWDKGAEEVDGMKYTERTPISEEQLHNHNYGFRPDRCA